jgi:hypothetical protein
MSIIYTQYILRQHTGIGHLAMRSYPIRLSAAGS